MEISFSPNHQRPFEVMTAEQAIATFSPTGIFELTWVAPYWRVFYRCKRHFDNPNRPDGCDYRFVDGDSVLDAIANAIAQQVKERLT